MCYLRNPRNIKLFLSGYPTGKTGDRGDRKDFYVKKFCVPFLFPNFKPALSDNCALGKEVLSGL